MPENFAIASARVITPDGEAEATVFVEAGKIRSVVSNSDQTLLKSEMIATGVDAAQNFGELVISPGIVDAHVHINDPGTDWEGFESATAAAAAGGVTTLIDMPLNSLPVTTDVQALRIKRQAAVDKCHVDVGFYGGLVPGNESQLHALVEAGVFGIKAFLCDSGLDAFPAATEKELRASLAVLGPSRTPLLAHAEIAQADAAAVVHDPTSYTQYAASRPPQFELAAIELLIDLCREYQSPVHIVHLATAEALPMIAAAKRAGLPLTVETCPHYLYFSADQIADADTRFKCAPPIRNESNRAALCEAVTSGLIDTIGSDHSPCPADLKLLDQGNFTKAWGGIAGLQLTLPTTWTTGKQFDWTPSLLAARLSQRPAEVFGLADCKGQLAAGFDADLVVWDPNREFTVEEDHLFHRHSVTPYAGCKLHGVVNCTYVRGNVVYNAMGNNSTNPLPLPRIGKTMERDAATSQESIASHLNALSKAEKFEVLETCCASAAWVERLVRQDKFGTDEEVKNFAAQAWADLVESDYLQAFDAHPRIGDVDSLRKKYANTKALAGNEQAGVDSATETTLLRLAAANDEYFDKFGFIFIVCATGKTASEMLAILESRLPNDRETEIANAAAEQLKITLLRLEKLSG